MAEILFVLVTIYVVYVLQRVFCKTDRKIESGAVEKVTAKAEAVSEKKTEAVAVAEEKPAAKKSAAKKTTKPAAKPKAAVKPKTKSKAKSTAKAKAQPASAVPSGSLRNPDTGDVDKIASSYRMTKRWIKEALVTEGLLPKVYKTAELDDATKEKAKKAVDKLAKMDKYQ